MTDEEKIIAHIVLELIQAGMGREVARTRMHPLASDVAAALQITEKKCKRIGLRLASGVERVMHDNWNKESRAIIINKPRFFRYLTKHHPAVMIAVDAAAVEAYLRE